MRMFRGGKVAGSDSEQGASDERSVPTDEVPPRTAVQRLPVMPGRPLASASFPIDIPRRAGEGGGARPDTHATSGASTRDRSIVVGRDVRLSGEVHACDRLTLDGVAELTVGNCGLLQIGTSGSLRGTVVVTNADIGGSFDGTLTATERLTVRSTGRIVGIVRYGQIVIEAGGRVCGDVAATGADEACAPAAVSAERPAPAADTEFVVAAERG